MNSVGVMHTPPQAQDGLVERLGRLFVRVLGTEVPDTDTDLIDTGLLDSLALVNLIMELEEEFGLSVAYDELELDNFRTLNSIATFIQSCRKENGG